jgi:hypothetical protein
VIAKIFDQWQHDWLYHRPLFYLELLGVGCSLLAAIFISFFANNTSLQVLFALWLCGSICLTITSYIRSHGWPMLLMMIYTCFNLVGLIKNI